MSQNEWLPRRLEEDGSSTSDDIQYNDSSVLRDTAILYGSIFVVVWAIFCWVRLQYSRPYTVRQWTDKEELKVSHNDILLSSTLVTKRSLLSLSSQTYLADNQYGFISWMLMLQKFTDDEIMEQCGMDSLCFLRTLRMGAKLCLLGVFNSIWLIPLYATAEESAETSNIDDAVVSATVANVPSGSARLVGTTLAAYLLFGYTMYLIMVDFKWFIGKRRRISLTVSMPREISLTSEIC